MIRNIIIVVLLLFLITDMSSNEFLDYITMGLDKLQQIVYSIQSEVN
jgi:hypothetical protein